MKLHEPVLPRENSEDGIDRRGGRLGDILVELEKLDARDVRRVLDLQRADRLRFGEAALRLGLIGEHELRQAIAKQYELPYLSPSSARISSELIVALEPLHSRSEELRALRTQLLIRWLNASTGPRMLAVVSPGSAEGRSYLAANLALAFAQLGERTLLVDADFRSPRQHRIFGVSDQVGLSAVLSGRADIRAAVTLPQFGAFSLLPAGASPPNPQELLLRPHLITLVQESRNAFDVVLFDTPPAKLYADAQCLALRGANAVVLARKDHTRYTDVAEVIRGLASAGVSVIGTILNEF